MLCRSVVQKVKNKTYKAIKKKVSLRLWEAYDRSYGKKGYYACLSCCVRYPFSPKLAPPSPHDSPLE